MSVVRVCLSRFQIAARHLPAALGRNAPLQRVAATAAPHLSLFHRSATVKTFEFLAFRISKPSAPHVFKNEGGFRFPVFSKQRQERAQFWPIHEVQKPQAERSKGVSVVKAVYALMQKRAVEERQALVSPSFTFKLPFSSRR